MRRQNWLPWGSSTARRRTGWHRWWNDYLRVYVRSYPTTRERYNVLQLSQMGLPGVAVSSELPNIVLVRRCAIRSGEGATDRVTEPNGVEEVINEVILDGSEVGWLVVTPARVSAVICQSHSVWIQGCNATYMRRTISSHSRLAGQFRSYKIGVILKRITLGRELSTSG